mmetsp:Transcript_128291/g.357090  ORF Transcript_128291/g.357090 Transcript_128291/m.357090 type:complete len:463 (-) Transcript_128291:740-2128(-)
MRPAHVRSGKAQPNLESRGTMGKCRVGDGSATHLLLCAGSQWPARPETKVLGRPMTIRTRVFTKADTGGGSATRWLLRAGPLPSPHPLPGRHAASPLSSSGGSCALSSSILLFTASAATFAMASSKGFCSRKLRASASSAPAGSHPRSFSCACTSVREPSALQRRSTTSFSSKRLRRRVWKKLRARRHSRPLRMTPLASMRPVRSCRSANSQASCVYTGFSCSSRMRICDSTSLAWTSVEAAASRCASSDLSCSSKRCIMSTCCGSRNFTSTMPAGSRMPPRDSTSAYISICAGLMAGSMTTQEPPRSSPPGGMYTKTGCRYSTRASTICAPNFSTSPYMSRVPPEKPRQLAKIITGRFSPRLKSRRAVAVLKALSGNHTCPACGSTTSRLCGFAGSAGTRRSTFRVSTAMTPMGMPPSFARPTTTLLPQPPKYSRKLPSSKNPVSRAPSGVTVPASMCRGS